LASTDLLTIVSTDWVDSTATRTRLGEDRCDHLQVEHDTILKAAIDQHDGRIVKFSGDGVLATFGSATSALGAAVAVQQRFEARTRRVSPNEAIAVRVGVSAGDIVHRDDDIFGTPVVEAVRLQAAAAPGQILCSDLVRALSRGRGGFDMQLVGLLDLKGLAEPVAACSVEWAPAETEAPLALPAEVCLGSGSRFVGRDPELESAIETALTVEQTHIIWLLGEPGIGKSRLSAEVATGVHARGAMVLYGRCDEQVRAPFQPVIDGLRWFVTQQRDDELRSVLGTDPEPLVRLVPELESRVPGLKRPEAVTETEQYRLFEAVRSWLGTISVTRPVVFVVDDVHWADRPTLALLGHIARHAQPSRLTLLSTARDTTPDISEALSDLVDELERTGRSRRLKLRGLSADAVGAMVEDAAIPAARLEQLVRETAGNPLFVRAVLSGMSADGSLASDLPTDVRAAVRRRFSRIERDTQELLHVAALSGLEFSLGVVSDAAQVGEGNDLASIEQAVHAGLVEEVSVDRFRFTHALVRDALLVELSASRQARMHAALGGAIERRYAARLDDHLRALAQHYALAGVPELLERALDYAERSAGRAHEILAFEAAVEDYNFALSLVAQMHSYPSDARIDLLVAKGDAQRQAGDHVGAMETFTAASELARVEGDPARFARVAIEFEETAWRPGLFGSAAVALLRTAAANDGGLDAKDKVWIRASLGRALHYTGAFEDAREVAEAALADAREIGDPILVAHAITASIQTLAMFRSGEAELVLQFAEEAADLAKAVGDPELVGTPSQFATVASLFVGNRERFDFWLAEFARVSEIAPRRFGRYVALCDQQLAAYLSGELVLAETISSEALAYGQGRDDVSGVHGVQMFLIRRDQGRLAELAPVVRMLMELNPAEAMWGPGLALLLVETDMRDQARDILRRLADDDFAALPRDILYDGSLCLLAEAAFLLGEEEIAVAAERALEPWRGYGATIGHVTGFLGANDRYRGLAAWTVGDLDTADRRLARAVEFDRRLGAVPCLARTLTDLALLRVHQGRSDSARELAQEARSLADRHQLDGILAQLDRSR
jgi:class 3 adenylate cyclase/tetratricopeptide (TPR) repeat protein